jgi:hypothetical protein
MDMNNYNQYWRVHVRLPDRFGHRCRVLFYARMNTCLVEFEDGFQVVTCRYYVRRIKGC